MSYFSEPTKYITDETGGVSSGHISSLSANEQIMNEVEAIIQLGERRPYYAQTDSFAYRCVRYKSVLGISWAWFVFLNTTDSIPSGSI